MARENRNGWCPVCREATAMDSQTCAKCGADFSAGSVWKPQHSSSAYEGVGVFARALLAVVSAVCLMPGLLFGISNHKTSWVLVSLGGLLSIAFVAATARAGWMLLVLMGSVVLGLTTCTHTFHWG